MIDDIEDVRGALISQINKSGFHTIAGCEALAAFAEGYEIDGIDLESIGGAAEKWSARGRVSLGLLNGDAERFGEVSLYLIASGHRTAFAVSVDSLIISPELH